MAVEQRHINRISARERMFFMKLKKRILFGAAALAVFALASLAGFAGCFRKGELPVMGAAAEKEEGKKIALTFDDEVILGPTQEKGI